MLFQSYLIIQNNRINIGTISRRFMGACMTLSTQPKIRQVQDEDDHEDIIRKTIYYREENEIIDASNDSICREIKNTKLLDLAKDMISQVFETDSSCLFDKKKQ